MGLIDSIRQGLDQAVRRARRTGVGTEDPNIVGDAGPVDVPPGRDPDTLGGIVAVDPDDDRPDKITT